MSRIALEVALELLHRAQHAADPSWRRGRSPPRRRSAARRRRTCPGSACARRCTASPRRAAARPTVGSPMVRPRIEVERRPPSATRPEDHRRRSCRCGDSMQSVKRSMQLAEPARSRSMTSSGSGALQVVVDDRVEQHLGDRDREDPPRRRDRELLQHDDRHEHDRPARRRRRSGCPRRSARRARRTPRRWPCACSSRASRTPRSSGRASGWRGSRHAP